MSAKVTKLDATDQVLGRLASEVALKLRGKHLPEFAPHLDMGCSVVVKHTDKISFTGKKLSDKIYYRHSGYPGGLKERSLQEVIDKKGRGEVLKLAVWNMLPKNKLRARMIKRLVIKS